MQVSDKQIELLKKGDVESWNAWRFSDLSMRPCLDGIDLSGCRLQDLVLWRLRLRNCVLNGADLRNADMRGSDFSNTSFVGSDLTGAACWQSRFSDCDLSDAVLHSANIEECSFTDPVSSQLANQARMWYLLPGWYAEHLRQPPEPPEGSLAIALLGDCTVSAGYLPPSQRPCAILARSLAEPGYEIPAFVYDLSRDGMNVEGALSRYEHDVLPIPRIDIAFIRYGITDRKEYGAERFIQLLGHLCQRLEEDFTNVRIVIETGIYVDYPEHYPFDRNAKLVPPYEKARGFAADHGYHLVEIYAELEKRTIAGDWDWRIRGLGIGRPLSLHDASQDHLHEGDPDWFFNIHPNRRCIQLIAEMERDAVVKRRELE
ncbi:pentapeptide repeat-containing protein [Candidatus Poribacteria bacterium]